MFSYVYVIIKEKMSTNPGTILYRLEIKNGLLYYNIKKDVVWQGV